MCIYDTFEDNIGFKYNLVKYLKESSVSFELTFLLQKFLLERYYPDSQLVLSSTCTNRLNMAQKD